MSASLSPTKVTYDRFQRAYQWFNRKLFDNRLPNCLITMQRRAGSYGYFARQRFATRDGANVTDEIALNPNAFRHQPVEEILSTLVHEMTHLEQFHFGNPSRGGYHNKEWAGLMKRVGLQPSNTGRPGGKETGSRMSHYTVQGGPFERTCKDLLGTGFTLDYVDIWPQTDRKKAESKTRYTCPGCGLNAWGKPALHLICGECRQVLRPPVPFTEAA
jgi:hypothetical protein